MRGRVAAGSAGLLLNVERALATTAAQCVRLVVALTEACRTLAYNLLPSRRVSRLRRKIAPMLTTPCRIRQAAVLLPAAPPSNRIIALPPSYKPAAHGAVGGPHAATQEAGREAGRKDAVCCKAGATA